MKFLTKKDIEILKLIYINDNSFKSKIARQSNYLSSNLDHTFNKLESEGYISCQKDKNNFRSIVSLTVRGKEVLTRQ